MDFIGDILSAPLICVGWIIVGAIAGALARTIMRSQDAPFFSDLLLGIAGAIIGGFIASLIGLGPRPTDTGLTLVLINLVIATVGAAVLLALKRALTRT